MRNFLTDLERDQLKSQHKKERDKKVCDRIKAVLLYDKGWTLMQIAEALLLSDDAIRQHISEYKASRKLKPESGGSIEKLSIKQSQLFEKHLQEHTYLYIKDILAYVKSVYKTSYTVSGMRYWLKRHHFSYKKPALVPGKANEEKQKEWIQEYEKLKLELPEDETICFMDGVHPTHNTQLTYGWIKKGFRKELAANSGRSRLNLSGAFDVLSKKVIVQEDEALNAESTIGFLKKIEEAYPSKNKVHLFCDNARYYRNRSVKAYLENSKVLLHFLPPYSPNLNPIERLWKWMKERVMYNTYYEEFEDFKSAIMSFFKSLSRLDPESECGKAFASRIRDKFRPIGSPLNN
jgi:transposase